MCSYFSKYSVKVYMIEGGFGSLSKLVHRLQPLNPVFLFGDIEPFLILLHK